MRSDLGRLDAIAEILQVGSFLGQDSEKAATGLRKKFMPEQKDQRRV
jgi:hypothetical protein